MQSSYSVFHAFILSFYSKRFYYDVARKWDGKSFLYLLLLCFLLSLYYCAFIFSATSSYLHVLVSQAPTITVTDGKIHLPENKPYFINDPETHETIAIIDTSGQYQSLEGTNTPILITQTQIITQQENKIVKTYTIPEHYSKTFDESTLKSYITKIKLVAFALMYLMALFFSYTIFLMITLLIALVGKLFSILFNANLSYWQVLQISMVAITPALCYSTLNHFLSWKLPSGGWVNLILILAYLIFGIFSAKKSVSSDVGK